MAFRVLAQSEGLISLWHFELCLVSVLDFAMVLSSYQHGISLFY